MILDRALLSLVGMRLRVGVAVGLAAFPGCRGPGREAADPPPPPPGTGPVRVDVVYPSESSFVEVRDSNFIFGSVGNGRARLTISGYPVPVAPSGAFFAWLPVPASPGDAVASYALVAALGAETVRVTRTVWLPKAWRSPPTGRAAIDSASLFPAGVWWAREGERIPVRVKATRGARVRMVLPDGGWVPLTELRATRMIAGWAAQGSARGSPTVSAGTGSYEGSFAARTPLGRGVRSSHPPVAPPASSGSPTRQAYVEVVTARDRVQVPLPLDVFILEQPGPAVELRDPRRLGGHAGGIVGRAVPKGAVAWLWANGVRARVTGRQNAALRIALDGRTEAWVEVDDVVWLPDATLQLPAQVGSVSLDGLPDRLEVRVAVGESVPYAVQMDERRFSLILYGVQSATYWVRYGRVDGFLRSARWEQVTMDRYALHLTLADEPWGYRIRYQRGALLLEVRKPPLVDARQPLAGRTVVLDPGHPPGGVTGPTRLSESDVNLAVAFRVKRLLEREGATVVLTRTTRAPVERADRVLRVELAEGDVLVSIHNNAPGVGANPFEARGTTVYYFHPVAMDLARVLQQSLLKALGQRDLGIFQTSLALPRVSWLPSVVVEGTFMVFPDQEAALRDPDFLAAYAQGVTDGIRAFLTLRARRKPP